MRKQNSNVDISVAFLLIHQAYDAISFKKRSALLRSADCFRFARLELARPSQLGQLLPDPAAREALPRLRASARITTPLISTLHPGHGVVLPVLLARLQDQVLAACHLMVLPLQDGFLRVKDFHPAGLDLGITLGILPARLDPALPVRQ